MHSRGSLALGGRFAGRTVRFLRSRPVIDRGSVFVAHLAFPVSTEAEANAALSARKRACAGDVVDHAMSAWRVPKRGTGRGEEKRKPAARKKPMTETFFDDDGETRGRRRDTPLRRRRTDRETSERRVRRVEYDTQRTGTARF